ncbi:hypothetical protein AB9K34_15915 [Sedimentitalea sp. XS_ASV28]
MSIVMSERFNRPDRPLPNLWTEFSRGHDESALDCETAVSLACHLSPTFNNATDWSSLVRELAAQGFALMFQGERLILVNEETGIDLCTCAFLGHSFASLTERMGKPCVEASTARIMPRPHA